MRIFDITDIRARLNISKDKTRELRWAGLQPLRYEAYPFDKPLGFKMLSVTKRDDTMQDFLIKALFTVLTLAVLIGLFSLYSWYANKSLRRDDRIRAAGHKIWATLVSTHPTGQSAVNNAYRQYAAQYYVLLELDVPQPNGTSSRCTTKGLPPPDWHLLQPGDQVQVYQNPDDLTQVVLDTIMSPRYSKAN